MRFSAPLLFLIVVAAADDGPQPLREFIDGFRSASGRGRYDLTLPPAPEAPEGARLTVEYRVGHYSVAHGILRFTPGKDHVEVTRTVLGSYLPGFKRLAIRGIGVRFERATLPLARYRKLVSDLLAIHEARLALREGAKKGSGGWAGTSADGALVLALEAGGKRLLHVDATLPIGGSQPGDALPAFGDEEHAFLWHERVVEAIRPLKFEPFVAGEAEPKRLLAELRALPPTRIYGQILRIQILGSLGYAPARDVLPALKVDEDWGDIMQEHAQVAVHQIDVLNNEDPRRGLIELVNHDLPGLQDWAHEVLRTRYPEDYKQVLLHQFRTGGSADKVSAIVMLDELDEKDLTLARLGLKEKSARVRVRAARVVWRAAPSAELEAVFHAIARDRALTTYREFFARTSAIETMTWGPDPIGDPRKVLTELMLDETDDVVVRGSAALGLGYLGDKRAIPALLKLFRSKVPQKPVYLHGGPDWVPAERVAKQRTLRNYIQTDDVRMDAARSLGILRATEAVDALIAYLDQPPKDAEHNLRPAIATALARIGSPKARKVLTKLRDAQKEPEDKEPWQRRLDVLDALNGKDPGADLLRLLADGYSDPIWIVIALADTCDRGRLERLRKEFPDFDDVLARALARTK